MNLSWNVCSEKLALIEGISYSPDRAVPAVSSTLLLWS